jgi:hypothetical protein
VSTYFKAIQPLDDKPTTIYTKADKCLRSDHGTDLSNAVTVSYSRLRLGIIKPSVENILLGHGLCR